MNHSNIFIDSANVTHMPTVASSSLLFLRFSDRLDDVALELACNVSQPVERAKSINLKCSSVGGWSRVEEKEYANKLSQASALFASALNLL